MALRHRLFEFYVWEDVNNTFPIGVDLVIDYASSHSLTFHEELVAINGGEYDFTDAPSVTLKPTISAYDPDLNGQLTVITGGVTRHHTGLLGTHEAGEVMSSAYIAGWVPKYGDWVETDTVTFEYGHITWTDSNGTNLVVYKGDVGGSFSYTVAELKASQEIDAIVSITDVPAFTNTQNPSVRYSATSESLDIEARVVVCDTYGTQILSYRELPTNSTFYTIELSAEDHSKLMAKVTTGNSTSLIFKIEYRVNLDGSWTSWVIADSFKTTYTIANVKPVITPKVEVVDQSIINLTGNNSTLIRYHGTARCTLEAYTSDSSAEIESRVVIYNGETRPIAKDAYLDIVVKEANKFTFRATDTRGNITEKSITLDMVNYIPLTCDLVSITAPDAATGAIEFLVKGNYYNGSFGAQNNTLDVQYRYKLAIGNTYGAWTSVPAEKLNIAAQTTYSCRAQIPGLDYTEAYNVEIRAIDKIKTEYTQNSRVASLPVFDWSKSDFNINVPTTINGIEYAKNVVLWSSDTGSQMTSVHTAYLNQPIQDQAHGIVLVFAAADGDVSWNTHFVPKQILQLNNGGGHTFLLGGNSAFGIFGAKYLYIYDDMIQGHTSNNGSGSGASGINYNNAYFVLRAVIGV